MFISPRFLGVLCVSALSCGLLYSQQLACSNGQCEGVIHGTAPACARLRIQAHGAVTLEGGGAKEISYTLRFAVSARSAAEARRLLEASPVRIESQGPWTVVTAPGGAVMSALTVAAPHLEAAAVVTAVGAVRANGVAGALEIRTGAGTIDVGHTGGALQLQHRGGPDFRGQRGWCGDARNQPGGYRDAPGGRHGGGANRRRRYPHRHGRRPGDRGLGRRRDISSARPPAR